MQEKSQDKEKDESHEKSQDKEKDESHEKMQDEIQTELQTKVQVESVVKSQANQNEEVKKQWEDSRDIKLNNSERKTVLWTPRCLLDVLCIIEEQVIGIYHKSSVSKQIENKLDQHSSISKILENLNTLVSKYYVEELKPEHEKFRFRMNHLSIPSLWPAYNRRLVFFLNISSGIFKNKIWDLLSYEHLSEIGYNVYIDMNHRK